MRTRAPRRVKASLNQLENTLKAAKNCGLTATGVSHYPDGRTVVHFGGTIEDTKETKPDNSGWTF